MGVRAIVNLPDMRDYNRVRENLQNLEIPSRFNFGFDVVDRRATESPDKIAFISVDRSGESIEPTTFEQLKRKSNQVARALLQLGVKKGDLALLIIPRIPEWYESIVGCTKAGVVAMPGTNLLTAKDIEYRLNKSKASVAVVTAEHALKIDSIIHNCPHLRHVIIIADKKKKEREKSAKNSAAEQKWREGWMDYETVVSAQSPDGLSPDIIPDQTSEDTMLVYFTSGTTSFPKMVPRNHAYAYAQALTGKYWLDLGENDVHWTLSDTGWAKAAWGMLYPQWISGATTVLYNGDTKFDPDIHLSLLEKLKITTFCAPPTVYRVFAQMDLTRYDLSSLRHCVSAGEPLDPETMRVWKQHTDTDIYDGYGQTETICIVANFRANPIRPGSMGKPMPGIDVQVVSEEGDVVPDGEVGNIAVKITETYPPGLFRGYYDDTKATDAVFKHGWYYTGDTAKRDKDGYLWFVGRSDDIITSSGYRISPFEVESALSEHPAVAEAAVVAKPDRIRGAIVKAFVILASGYAPSDKLASEIQTHVKEVTAAYKYPREIEFRTSLPKTISGKIRRVELREEQQQPQ